MFFEGSWDGEVDTLKNKVEYATFSLSFLIMEGLA